jgi:hypothetical protein
LPWPITCDRFVAFLDIMGFTNMLATLTAAEMYARMCLLHDEVRAAEAMARGIVAGPDGSVTVSDTRNQEELVRLVQFSDSTVAISRDGSDECSLAIRLAALKLFSHSLAEGFAFRGAIAFGNISADFERSIFFGEPIVQAYRLEGEQAWYGVIEHPSCTTAFGDAAPELGDDEIALSEPYMVPLKSGRRRLPAINWPVFMTDLGQIERALEPLASGGSEALDTYYRNTRSVAKEVWLKYRSRT